jgi:FtsP/CotA-like multicopper oxidase with cupredoxin domain
MGQAPGTHWYHAHKHGSTTINVMNGMTGVFIVEGPYDDALNSFYGEGWARQQPVLVINEYGVSPKLYGGGNTLPFSVNGRRAPRLTMQPGEVQLWRIANTSSRSGAYFVSPPQLDPTKPYDPAKDFQWKQTAQDGVQFTGGNYDGNQNFPFLLAAGNRADLLVKAPANQTGQAQIYTLQVIPAVSAADTQQQKNAVTFLTVQVASGPSVTGNSAAFIPAAQFGASFPPFLADITPDEVKATKKIVFESSNGPPFTTHTVDGKKFDGNIGQVVLLNTVEEWKIENRTLSTSPTGPIDHPFHIHINPFQVVEEFSPNDTVTNAAGKTVPKYVFYDTPKPDAAQCYLDPLKPQTWKDCKAGTPVNIWWDVFPIPSAIGATDANGNPINDPKTGKQIVVPGYFKMRSRFVDYAGQYVMHCHILAHEDRGMMTIVEVTPYTTAYSHK